MADEKKALEELVNQQKPKKDKDDDFDYDFWDNYFNKLEAGINSKDEKKDDMEEESSEKKEEDNVLDEAFWGKHFDGIGKDHNNKTISSEAKEGELPAKKDSENSATSVKKEEDFDYDFWDKYFDEAENKNNLDNVEKAAEKKTDISTSKIKDEKSSEKKSDDNKKDDDDFAWLKDLIDEIDKEEQEKKKQQSNLPVPAPSTPSGKKSFTSKLGNRPRPPKPPEHVTWGPPTKKGIPVENVQQNVVEKKSHTNMHLYYLFGSIMIFFSALLVGYVYFSGAKSDTWHGSNIVMNQMYSGDKILLDIQSIHTKGKEAVQRGYLDAQISSLMYQLVKPGDKVIDVGAGFGYYTIYLARIVGQKGIVYSFEARRNTFELLESSIRINKLDNVKTYNQILFSENKRMLLDTNDYQKRSHFGVSNLIAEQNNIHNGNEVGVNLVNVQTLDSILQNISNISLLHINAHGSELNVILGAGRLIASSPRIKIITSWSKLQMAKHVNVQNVVSQLLDLGFHFWLIKPSSGALVELSRVEHIMQVESGRFIIAKSLN